MMEWAIKKEGLRPTHMRRSGFEPESLRMCVDQHRPFGKNRCKLHSNREAHYISL